MEPSKDPPFFRRLAGVQKAGFPLGTGDARQDRICEDTRENGVPPGIPEI